MANLLHKFISNSASIKGFKIQKKFYRNKIDPDFDIDYKPPEEEANSYSSVNTSSSSYSSNNT